MEDDDRARRLLAGADAWLAAGQWEPALAQLDQAAAFAVDPRPARRHRSLDRTTRVLPRRPGEGRADTRRGGRRHRARRIPNAATRLLTYAVNVAVFALDIDGAVTLAERAVACGERAGGLNVVSGAMARGRSRAACRRSDRAGDARAARATRRRVDRERPRRRRTRLQPRGARRLRPRELGPRRAPARRDGAARARHRPFVPPRSRARDPFRARVAARSLGRGLR